MALNIHECPFCRTTIIPTADMTCPSCQELLPTNFAPPVNEAMDRTKAPVAIIPERPTVRQEFPGQDPMIDNPLKQTVSRAYNFNYAMFDLFLGGICLLVGSGLTWFSFSISGNGGSMTFFVGLIVFGIYRIVRPFLNAMSSD